MISYGILDNKVYGGHHGTTWGQQDPGGPHVGPMNFAIWDVISYSCHKFEIYCWSYGMDRVFCITKIYMDVIIFILTSSSLR